MKLETILNFLNADAGAVTAPSIGVGSVNGFSIDSRTVKPGDLFFALAEPDYRNNGFNGEFGDGHEFLGEAFERGATAAVVRQDRILDDEQFAQYHNRLLPVNDCIVALQEIAAGVYREWAKPIVGITGSAGKTTAKEFTAAVLEFGGQRVLRNEKNYNNGLGLPLTVLRLVSDGNHYADYDLAVLEMGMSTPLNEIQKLCRITPPDVAVELNVLGVHLEHLGTIENIAAAKRELIEGLKPNGTAVLNADDRRVIEMRGAHNGKTLTFGIKNKSDVMARSIENVRFGETRFELVTPDGTANTALQLAGRHNIMNALAAAAVGASFGLDARVIADALRSVAPPPMRGELLRFRAGFEVVNDAYNSNPDALRQMVATLIENGAGAGRKIVVAGEMLELGAEAARLHRETGAAIADSGVEVLFGVRGLGRELVDGAREAGIGHAEFFADADEAAEILPDFLRAGDLVLIKGSRGVRLETVVQQLRDRFELAV